jgi:hypothetical protein
MPGTVLALLIFFIVEQFSLFSAPLRDFQTQLWLVDALYIVANGASGFGSGRCVPVSNILCTYPAQSHIMP